MLLLIFVTRCYIFVVLCFIWQDYSPVVSYNTLLLKLTFNLKMFYIMSLPIISGFKKIFGSVESLVYEKKHFYQFFLSRKTFTRAG